MPNTDADGQGRGGVGSMRTPADKGEGGQKLAKSCGHLLSLWMAPRGEPDAENMVREDVNPINI